MNKHGIWVQMRPRDRLMVAVLVPIWFLSLLLHLDLAANDLLLRPVVILSSPEQNDGYPVVSNIFSGAEDIVEEANILVGDEILTINQRSLQGVSGFRSIIIAQSQLGGPDQVTATFRRGEHTERKAFPFHDYGVPWWWPSLFAFSFGIVGLLVLLSAPTSRTARAVFPAFISLALTWLVFFGKSEIQSYASVVIYAVSMVFAAPLILKAIILLPEKTAIRARSVHYGIWVFALMSVTGISAFAGVPLDATVGQTLHLLLITLFYLATLLLLARNYYCANKLGRRQLRWVLLGFYLALIPAMIVTAVIIQYPEQFSLYALSSIGMPIIPIMFLVAITRYNLFDIDRLIGGSVSYTILVILIAVLAEVVIEPVVAVTATNYGFDGNTVQVMFVAALTAVLIPAQKRWRPLINRIFFAEGVAVETSIEALIRKLDSSGHMRADDRFKIICGDLARIFGFERWAVFGINPESEKPIATKGSDRQLSIDSALWQEYEKRVRPGLTKLANGERFLVAPIRPAGKLEWLLVMGAKPSGDIYTTTDQGLISSITHTAGMAIADYQLAT